MKGSCNNINDKETGEFDDIDETQVIGGSSYISNSFEYRFPISEQIGLMGVGFIVGSKVSAILFAGAVLGWLVLVPLAIFINPSLVSSMGDATMEDLFINVWQRQIRPLAVGTMILVNRVTVPSAVIHRRKINKRQRAPIHG